MDSLRRVFFGEEIQKLAVVRWYQVLRDYSQTLFLKLGRSSQIRKIIILQKLGHIKNDVFFVRTSSCLWIHSPQLRRDELKQFPSKISAFEVLLSFMVILVCA